MFREKNRCQVCNEVFEEAVDCQECIGYYGSMEVYQNIACCPKCGNDDLEEVVKCEICDGYYLDEELSFGVCEHCVDEAKMAYNMKFAKQFLQKNKLEEDFYIDYAAMIYSHDCDGYLLIEALKINQFNSTPIFDFERKLKDYCLDAKLENWIEFYFKKNN